MSKLEQNRVTLIVTRDLDTDEIRVSVASGNTEYDRSIRIAGNKFCMSNVEEILVEDIKVAELLQKIKEVQVKRMEFDYD